MRVLVTGSSGYIGSVLVPRLRAQGHDVIGIDSDWFADCVFGEAPADDQHRQLDIRDLQCNDLTGFDAVCHLAALSNDPLGNLSPRLTEDINHLASVRLARLAKQAGVQRFVFSSSCSLYGASGNDLLTEEAAFNPVTPYGASKIAVEHELAALADDAFSPVYLRNATAYGVSPRLRLDLVLNEFVAGAVLHGRILIRSDGTPWRPVVHVNDICQAFSVVLQAPLEAVHNQAFNVGRTDENYRVSDLADFVRQAVSGCKVEYAAGGGPDLRCYRVDCSKLPRAVPTFQPQWNVHRGIEQLREAYRTVPLTLADEIEERFLRLPTLQRQMNRGAISADLRTRPTEHAALAAS